MRTITYAQAIKEALEQEMRRDPSVVLYGEDVANFGGIFQITSGMQEQFGEERVFDTPISENAFVGAAVGAAITGLRPVVELQFADFLFTTGDEVVLKAGMWRYGHGGAYKVPLVVRCPSGAAGVGPEHGQCPEAFFMHSPGLKSFRRQRLPTRRDCSRARFATTTRCSSSNTSYCTRPKAKCPKIPITWFRSARPRFGARVTR